jgi:hypothetical protein
MDFTPRRSRRASQEHIRQGLDDGQARRALEPEELAARVDLEEHVPAVGGDDEVGGGVVEPEPLREPQQAALDALRQGVGLPRVEERHAFFAPIEPRAREHLRIDGGGEDAATHHGGAQLEALVELLLEGHR